MNLKKLKESNNLDNDIIALSLTIMDNVSSVEDFKKKYKTFIAETYNYTKSHKLAVTFTEAVKTPLWNKIKIKPSFIIHKGFPANVIVETNVEKFDDITIKILLDKTDINETSFTLESALEAVNHNKLQTEIISEKFKLQEKRLLEALLKMWEYEQKRVKLWIDQTSIKL